MSYILDPAGVHGPDFPGETFRVLKDKEQAKFGEFRTRRLVLEAWDRHFISNLRKDGTTRRLILFPWDQELGVFLARTRFCFSA